MFVAMQNDEALRGDFVGMVKQVEQTCKQQQWRLNEKTDCITNKRKSGLLQESAD
jgi:hypothetical protein